MKFIYRSIANHQKMFGRLFLSFFVFIYEIWTIMNVLYTLYILSIENYSETQYIKHRHDSPANKLNDNIKQTFVNSLSKVQSGVFFVVIEDDWHKTYFYPKSISTMARMKWSINFLLAKVSVAGLAFTSDFISKIITIT